MHLIKIMVLSAMAGMILVLAGCSDRNYSAEEKRSPQVAEELRDRIMHTQGDR